MNSNKPRNSCWKHHLLLFLAGGEAYLTIIYIIFAFGNTLPIQIFGMELTQKTNFYLIVINAIIASFLLWWSSKMHHSEH